MNIKQLFNIKNLKNKDLLDIRPFVIVFSIYSLISIWSADMVYNKAFNDGVKSVTIGVNENG